MRALALGLTLLFSPQSSRAEPTAELQKLLSKGQTVTNIDGRIELYSKELLGRVYALGPLGEGASGKYDQGPLYRFDTFDCTTYIETVSALALSQTPAEFEKNLKRLRYRNGEVDFTARNHFPDLDWMPNNVASGMVTDITASFAQKFKLQTAEVDIDKANWFRHLPEDRIQVATGDHAKLLNELHNEGSKFKSEKAQVRYISFKDLFRREGSQYRAQEGFFDTVASGTFVNFVIRRRARQGMGTTMLIWHQGVLIRKNGELWLRHAANLSRRTIEVPAFEFFLYEFLGHQWDGATDAGVSLFRLSGK